VFTDYSECPDFGWLSLSLLITVNPFY